MIAFSRGPTSMSLAAYFSISPVAVLLYGRAARLPDLFARLWIRVDLEPVTSTDPAGIRKGETVREGDLSATQTFEQQGL
jgi:hypothetical protein